VTENNPQLTAAIEHLGQRRADALATLELLRGYREQIETSNWILENPTAVLEYIDFFVDMVSRSAAECERIAAELPQGIFGAHPDALRQIASNSAAEQRRCLMFRDKWINKPLPDERMRPLLNEISVTTRDQLTAFRDLNNVAAQLEEFLKPATPPTAEDKRAFDRRALFTRLFKP
jgi:hypothetical protein